MKKKIIAAGVFGLAFIVLMIFICAYDVDYVGPRGTAVGFSTLNKSFHDAHPFNELWYEVSEIFGYLAIAVAGAFVALGVEQAIKRKKIDTNLWKLAGLYTAMMATYVWFELIIINYRPIIMPGEEAVEASFPSSHVMLACVIMGGAFVLLKDYVKIGWLRITLKTLCVAVAALTVVFRLLSGVHWLTDIIGGVLCSLTLVIFFAAVCDATEPKE